MNGLLVVPCSKVPELWFETTGFPAAIHGCVAHCPGDEKRRCELSVATMRPRSQVLAGIAFDKAGKPMFRQPVPRPCPSCRIGGMVAAPDEPETNVEHFDDVAARDQVADIIRRLRGALSRPDLAKLTGVGATRISHLEHHVRTNMNVRPLETLATYFGYRFDLVPVGVYGYVPPAVDSPDRNYAVIQELIRIRRLQSAPGPFARLLHVTEYTLKNRETDTPTQVKPRFWQSYTRGLGGVLGLSLTPVDGRAAK
jgi:transcriptional regulator with XRE-family HTH domain